MKQPPLTRRGLVRALGAGVAAAALGRGTVGEARATEGDWRHSRHDRRNTGNAVGHDVPTVGLTEDWRLENEGIGFAPTVADGLLYVCDEAGVHAVDEATGSREWSASIGRVIGSAPVLEGTVFAGNEEGNVYAFDAETGEERWRFETEAGARVHTPAVAGDSLYVGTMAQRLYALSPIDGTEQWRVETSGAIRSSPAVADGTLYVGDMSGTVYALSAADGAVEWTTEVAGEVIAYPAVVDGTAYLGDVEGSVYALSTADGSLEWEVPTEDFVVSPAVADGTVYVKSGEFVRALSTADGSERWRVQVGGQWSAPVVADGTVLVGGERRLYSLGADDGEVLDRFEARTQAFFSPIAVNGSIYVNDRSGGLFALGGGVRAAISGLSHAPWGGSTTFSATESVTSAESIERYEWTIDGVFQSSDTGPRTTVSFWGPGPVDIELTVTDSQGRTARANHSVYVQNSIMFWALSGVAGLAGVGTVGGVGVRRLRAGSDDASAGGATGRPSSPPDTEGGSDDAAGPNDAFERFVDAAEGAADDAERHRGRGNFDAAIDAYDEAIQQYFAALNRLPDDDDRREDLRATREEVESTRTALAEQRETHAELVDTLHTAESNLQTAIAAPTSDRVVIPRERYRQAQEAYDRALDLYDELDDPPETLTVSPDVDIGPPPETLSRFPGVTPTATERLEELGVDTLSALRDADKETVADLRSGDAIHDKLAARLVGLHHWLGDEDLTLAGQKDIERRKELAEEGYRVHR